MACKKPKVVVTLGFGDGQAFFTFCQAVLEQNLESQCVAVRRNRAGEEPNDDVAWVRGNEYGHEFYGHLTRFLHAPPGLVATEFPEASVDFLFLDDSDSGTEIGADLRIWQSKLAPNGLLLVHGTTLERNDNNPKVAWLECAASRRAVEVSEGIGLGIALQWDGSEPGESLLKRLFAGKESLAEVVEIYRLAVARIEAQANADEALRKQAALETRQIWLQFLLDDRWTAQDVMDDQARHISEQAQLLEERGGQLMNQQAALTEQLQRFEALRRDRAKAQLIMDAQQEQVRHWLGVSERLKAEKTELKTELKSMKQLVQFAKAACRRGGKCFQVSSGPKTRKPLPAKILRELQRIPRQLGLLSPPAPPLKKEKPALTKVTPPVDRYAAWIAEREPDAAALEAQRCSAREMKGRPKFSLLVPVHDTPGRFLDEMLESIVGQTYDNWELCVVDAGSTKPETRERLAHWEAREPKLRLLRLSGNLGIAENTNRALAAASGEFIACVDHDDVLAPFALYELARAFTDAPGAEIFYSDEDRLGLDGKRHSPFFKPEWSPSLLTSFMYIGHLTAYRRLLVAELGCFRKEFDFSQDYDLALRATDRSRGIHHIPHVLYHWREHPASGSMGGKPEARKSNLAALADAMQRRNLPADVVEYPTTNRARRKLAAWPRVSIVVPTDSPTRAQICLTQLPLKTRYPDLEIVLVTNSKLAETLRLLRPEHAAVQLVPYDKPFNFSDKCNTGAQVATGERVIFFNDDVEPTQPDWIQNVIEQLEDPEIGAVSPKLLYETGKIQHAGIVMGVRGLAGTAFHQRDGNTTEYFNLAQSLRDVSVLSGACLAVRRSDFLRLGGFDAINTAIGHSDIDLCFRIREAGLRCVYTPFATLTHAGHVSISVEESEQRARARDKANIFLLRRWAGYTTHDPYFTENMRDWLHVDSSTPIRMSGRNDSSPNESIADLLFVSHDLSLSGAPMMLLNAALWCQQHGYFITLMSPLGGALQARFEAADIPVIIDPLIATGHESFRRLARDFDGAVANTILSGPAVRALHAERVPVLWWLHEPASVGEHYLAESAKLRGALPLADIVVAPSEQTAAVYRAYTERPVHCLRNATPDLGKNNERARDDFRPLKFLLLASVEPRKGQDVFVDAIALLPRELQQKAEWEIAGRVLDPDFGSKITALSINLASLTVSGAAGHAEAIELLRSADVLVCASRDEAMPTVTLLEAMSLGKAVIVTAVGGAAEFAAHGENALVVASEEPAQLADAMRRLITDRGVVRKLAENARASFEERFTMERFGGEFLELMRETLEQKASAS
ncbi:MAG: glycosyltransferase [Verrucomicrobiota bacterium]|nr:glycosyltransferase [Verrucomicrobiota bacterium]